jgi:hypothetical protein
LYVSELFAHPARRRQARELAEVAHEMGLVEVATGRGHGGDVRVTIVGQL